MTTTIETESAGPLISAVDSDNPTQGYQIDQYCEITVVDIPEVRAPAPPGKTKGKLISAGVYTRTPGNVRYRLNNSQTTVTKTGDNKFKVQLNGKEITLVTKT
jgi:hypothetical protein